MSHEPTPDRDEHKLTSLLRALDTDVALPDRDLVDALRIQSTNEFVSSASIRHSAEPQQERSDSGVESPIVQRPQSSSGAQSAGIRISNEPSFQRRLPVVTLAMRGAVAAAMSLVALAMWFISSGPEPAVASTVPFAKILDELRDAGTLEFRLVKDGTVSQILVRSPGLVRKEETSERYEIAAGSRLWKVDETTNTVTEGDSPWFQAPNSQVDLLSLLDVGLTNASELLRAKPVERVAFPFADAIDSDAGRSDVSNRTSMRGTDEKDSRANCLVYRVELPSNDGRVRIEAFVNEKTRRLVGVYAWPANAKRNAGPPLAELRLIAMNMAVADENFEVANSLTEDGRIGKVTQSQGIVVLRPMLAKRWTPIGPETVLKPGDWLRTELRGANAVKALLVSGVELTLGPGTLLECISPTKARVHSGFVQVQVGQATQPSEKAIDPADRKPDSESKKVGEKPANVASHEFTLLAPRDGSRTFPSGSKQRVRVDRDDNLVDVAQPPVWLAGFEGTTNNESLGSLMVNLPDGRNEPLSVGFHRVSVEIRDQIARTTIEESFVNHTPARLEGVFHFPLPQDASISGFGMWIGNELVEADVVEKQRAREIYETILRERRDPGLLEWTSGNIFKARVFPIEAHSEKRIRIVYTQVLPLRSGRYRYAYGLRSELLRTKPLRELSLAVTVNSAIPLKNVTCSTHSVRTQKTGHSAQVEFSAQEYTPTRDFEVICEIDRQQSDVVVVPHRRGDDGYFLVQVTPPFQANAQGGTVGGSRLNELVPDGKPLNIVLLCDTSGSMDSEKRKQQSEFVATVLSSLGPDDRFQIAACDVGTVWSNPELLIPSAPSIAAGLKFLDERVSMGWTNLDRAFDDVLKRVPAGAHVIYIGDGIVSSGDTDPAAFVRRLTQRIAEFVASQRGTDKGLPVTLHAVAVGNTNESVVVRGIATAGRGSVRTIGGEQSPRIVAREWLNEVAQPGLTDVNVEFRGFKVAAVYPERLPNVPSGTQQIIVGRYLPDSTAKNSDLHGEVIVTGLRGTEKVRFAARVSFKDAEEGNSFIPRLWARAHLDHLLAQGQNAAVHDQIIRMSEEFHIITPMTSLLVLETDADRERFGVHRRYEMRDGEQFFAAGRDTANFELLQQQMKRAGDWRIGMRRRVIQSLANLGRDPGALQIGQGFNRHGEVVRRSLNGMYRARGLGLEGLPGGRGGGRGNSDSRLGRFDFAGSDFQADTNGNLNENEFGMLGDFDDDSKKSLLDSVALPTLGKTILSPVWDGPSESVDSFDAESPFQGIDKFESIEDARGSKPSLNGRLIRNLHLGYDTASAVDGNGDFLSDGIWEPESGRQTAGEPTIVGLSAPSFYSAVSNRKKSVYYPQFDNAPWVNSLFPSIASRPVKLPAKEPAKWSPEAIGLARSLLREESLLKMDGGVELLRETNARDPQWDRWFHRAADVVLYSPNSWLTRNFNLQEQSIVHYCNEKERGVYSVAFLLGRSRASVAGDLTIPPPGLADDLLLQNFSEHSARVQSTGNELATLVLTAKNATSEVRLTIDTKRHVVVQQESFSDGAVTGRATYGDFVEVAGSWWATKIIGTDEKGRRTSESWLEFKTLSKEQYAERLNAELVDRPMVQLIRLPLVSLRVARQKVADGSATFDDRLVMILDNAQRQQWDEMWKHVDAIEKQAVDKPGIRWLRTVLLATIRRNDEARKRLADEVGRLLVAPRQDEVFLAEFILGQAATVSSRPESYELVRSLKPIYFRPFAQRLPSRPIPAPDREPVETRLNVEIQRQIAQTWSDHEMASFEGMGRLEEAIALGRTAAEEMPWDHGRQEAYARQLASAGQYSAAHAWLEKSLTRPELTANEDASLRNVAADLYRQTANWAELLKWTSAWIRKNPDIATYHSPYSQHLAAMICNDQLDDAYRLADQWLKDARVEGTLSAIQQVKFDAALAFANGNAHFVNFYRMDERWFEPLAEAARFFVRHQLHVDFVYRCTSNYYFAQSETADQLRGEWLSMLRTEIATLSPRQIGMLVGSTLSGRIELSEPLNGRMQLDASEVPSAFWKKIADDLKVRWTASQDKDEKSSLSETLRTIFASRFADTQLLPFLRERIVNADSDQKVGYVSILFDSLLTAKWTDEIEVEVFDRWRELTDKAQSAERLVVELPALLRLVDAMLANRITAAEQLLKDQGGLDKLTRKELAAKKADIRKAAQIGLAMRIEREAAKSVRNQAYVPVGERTYGLADWMMMEKLWLDVQLSQNLEIVENECWKILGDAPVPQITDEDDSDDDANGEASTVAGLRSLQRYFDSRLRQRAFVMVLRLCLQKQAELRDRSKDANDPARRILNYLDAGITQEDGRKSGFTHMEVTPQSFWRMAKFRVLIALDRPDPLEQELRKWIQSDVSTGPWRQSLARLVAERGRIDEAIQLFEACMADKLLSATDYKTLADWYLLANRRDAYDRSRVEYYQQLPEGNLQQMIYQSHNRWSQTNIPLPGALDENTLFAFRALFKKSAQPENYLGQLQSLYAASRDFRLFQMVPDAVLGRSPQQVYSFIQVLRYTVLNELRNEATADELLARVRALRTADRTATDLRALDLLEALVERKSAEVLNQPGPHIDACLESMRRAFDRVWSSGELTMMSQFLRSFGGITERKLQDEQLREVRALRQLAPVGSRERLQITMDLSQLLFWNYTRHDDGLREVEAEVRSYLVLHDGVWPHADNELLGSYVQMLEGASRHATGEAVLKKQLAQPANDEQTKWLNDRMMQLYNHALEHDGAVSIGTGRANLFASLFKLTLKELDRARDENVRYTLVVRINGMLEIAHRHKLPGSVEAAGRLAFEIMPVVLRLQQQQYRNTATTVLQTLANILEPKRSLQYVIERMEQWPQRLGVGYDTSWNAFGSELAARRAAVGSSEFDGRILKLAISQLQRDLRYGDGSNQAIYHHGYSNFWSEKASDFAKAAEVVLNERRSSGRRVLIVANYLRNGLHLIPRSIEILQIAHGKGLLDDATQYQLSVWLRETNRFAEMIPILEPLIAAHPDAMNYRIDLMVAYFQAQRFEQLADLTRKTGEHFHTDGRWTEGSVAQFARGCQETRQWELARDYLTEVIALHQRANPGSGNNDGTLSDYYQQLAITEASLDRTKEAVDAASAAIVCWNTNHRSRQDAMNRLREVLNSAKELDAYVVTLDEEAAKTGQDTPILRKAIGEIYQGRNQFAKAIREFQIALELQPTDKQIHNALIACHDAIHDRPAATRQLLKLIDLQRHDLALYQQLAERYKDDEAEAERAATSIIESSPNESEPHAAMAEYREKQNRWSEAIPHWERVANLRKLEPTGLLRLANAQLHEKQWELARASIQSLKKTEWPSRFNNITFETNLLEARLPK